MGVRERLVLKLRALKALVDRDWRLNGRAAAIEGRNRWRHPLRLLGKLDAEKIRAADIEGYKETRLKEGAARKSINNELGLVKRGYVLALDQEIIGRMPRIKNLRCTNVRQGFLEPPDYLAIVDLMQRRDVAAADVVRLMYLLGWRVSEVTGLLWNEVDPAAGTIRLPASRTKNRTPKAIRVGTEIRSIIDRRLHWKNGAFVFQRSGNPVRTFRTSWGEAVKAIGKPSLIPHDCRRSFAKNAVAAGLDIPLIMIIAGWKTMSVFIRYCIQDEARIEYGVERVSAYTASHKLAPPTAALPGWLSTALRSLSGPEKAEALSIITA